MARRTATRIRELGGSSGNEQDELGVVPLPIFVMTTLLGFLAVLIPGIWFGIQSVENNIKGDVLTLLAVNGQEDVEVSVSGRTVTIGGVVDVEGREDPDTFIAETLPQYLEAQLLGVDEIVVDENLRYLEPEREARDIVIPADPLVFTWQGSTAVISGTVSDDATFASLAAVTGDQTVPPIWDGVFTIVDTFGLSTKDGSASERDWLPTVITLVKEMQPLIGAGEIFVNPVGEVVRVTGEFESSFERNAARQTAKAILDAITFSFNSALTYEQEQAELPPPPEQQVIELQTNLDDLIEGKVVEFESGSADLTAAGRALLDEVVIALQQFPDIRVEIGGHTDDVGDVAYNLDLSERRAFAVLAFLINEGEPAERFTVVGYGESDPVADNATSEGRARNRRIEFTAFTEESTP